MGFFLTAFFSGSHSLIFLFWSYSHLCSEIPGSALLVGAGDLMGCKGCKWANLMKCKSPTCCTSPRPHFLILYLSDWKWLNFIIHIFRPGMVLASFVCISHELFWYPAIFGFPTVCFVVVVVCFYFWCSAQEPFHNRFFWNSDSFPFLDLLIFIFPSQSSFFVYFAQESKTYSLIYTYYCFLPFLLMILLFLFHNIQCFLFRLLFLSLYGIVTEFLCDGNVVYHFLLEIIDFLIFISGTQTYTWNV